MKDIYKIYNDVFNNRVRRFPMKFWNSEDSKENGIKLLQYITKELEMTEEEIQNLSQVDITRTFRLDGLYRVYGNDIMLILKDAFPQIEFTKHYDRESYKKKHSETIKNLPKEKWDKIKEGSRNNRYTKEYGKKLSDSQLGELNTCAKLKATDIPKIRQMWEKGYSAIEIGNEFGVKRQTINDIVFGRTWKHVE